MLSVDFQVMVRVGSTFRLTFLAERVTDETTGFSVSGVTLSTKKVKRKLDPTLVITWKSTDNIGVVSHDLLFADTTPVVSGLPGSTQTFTWTVPASIPKKTVGTVRVTARDAAGNVGEAVSNVLMVQ